MDIGGRLGGHSVSAWLVVWPGCDGFRLPPLGNCSRRCHTSCIHAVVPILRKITHTQKLENNGWRKMVTTKPDKHDRLPTLPG
jgi:hypothetical protein